MLIVNEESGVRNIRLPKKARKRLANQIVSAVNAHHAFNLHSGAPSLGAAFATPLRAAPQTHATTAGLATLSAESPAGPQIQ
jgi:hypothetical protein